MNLKKNTVQEETMPSTLKTDFSLKWGKVLKSRTFYMMMAPYFIIFTVFTVVPVLLSILVSFTDFNMLEFPEWVGWKNYARLLVQDDVFKIAVKNTLVFAVITGPISYFACFGLAWVINELPPRVRTFATLVFYAPSLSGSAYVV